MNKKIAILPISIILFLLYNMFVKQDYFNFYRNIIIALESIMVFIAIMDGTECMNDFYNSIKNKFKPD